MAQHLASAVIGEAILAFSLMDPSSSCADPPMMENDVGQHYFKQLVEWNKRTFYSKNSHASWF
jgi:hypothetical protein